MNYEYLPIIDYNGFLCGCFYCQLIIFCLLIFISNIYCALSYCPININKFFLWANYIITHAVQISEAESNVVNISNLAKLSKSHST